MSPLHALLLDSPSTHTLSLPAAQHTSYTQVYPFGTGTETRHERRAIMACLLLPPGQTALYALVAAVLLKLRRGLGCAAFAVR